MTRGWVLLAAALAFAYAADAGAQTKAPKTQAAPKAPAAHMLPLHAYLAKGESNACGEGCSEWIAIEGRFEPGSAGSVIALLQRHAARNLPVFFYSPGGEGREAIALGRFLRQRGMTAGVGKTIPRACESSADQASECRAAKRSAQAVAAEWRPDGICTSACVYAVIGGKVRQVPPSARLGVHSVKLTMFRKKADGRVDTLTWSEAPSLHQSRMAAFNGQLRRYIEDMGIDAKLFHAAEKVPHEQIHYLSRNEIAAYGIDRRAFAETPWFLGRSSNNNTYVSKWIVEAQGEERKDYRVSIIAFTCLSPLRASIRYLRGRTSAELGQPATATISIGKHKIKFAVSGIGTRQEAVDSSSLFSSVSGQVPFDAIEAAAVHGTIGYEADTGPGAPPSQLVELSTLGLADAIKQLKGKCIPTVRPAPWATGAHSAPWAPPAQVPFVPAQAGGESTPASPYGAYPVPELGLGTGGRASRKKK